MYLKNQYIPVFLSRDLNLSNNQSKKSNAFLTWNLYLKSDLQVQQRFT